MYVSQISINNAKHTNFTSKKARVVKKVAEVGVAASLLGISQKVLTIFQNDKTQPELLVQNKMNNQLKSAGIINFFSMESSIIGVTKYGGDFKITPPFGANTLTSGAILLSEVYGMSNDFGIRPYVTFVNDLKRFDIIKKGLNIKEADLMNVSVDSKKKAAKDLSRYIQKNVLVDDLFCIDNYAYYYDKQKSSIYSVKITDQNLGERELITCKFHTDKNGCAIGYDYTAKSYYSGRYETKTYIEQQEKNRSLKDVAYFNDYKEYAEANKFGNVANADKYMKAINGIVQRLKDKGFENVSKDDIKIAWTTRNGVEKVTLNYFDSTRGITRVFDKKGKYVDYITYQYGDDGRILNCFNYSGK